ncbi:MFS transporter [Micromonospora sp. DR5-3]|uniref:MFS transporter n=1 Tax=unclassified Micromonospora TaxID=2617518 RepID=UPI0011D536A4|nr:MULTISPECIES: MFS transporter [unclassified Micromonospora]MCW3816975.1 MFS transporter [Micromonospora sp. DR5-3]TYC24080.1 MFS transporter [Micromonospora sp. MP36]
MIETTRRGSRRLTFLVLAAGTGFFAMLQSLITPVLPTIQHDLHTSQNTVTWVLTAYLLSASIFTPVLGRVGDMVGKERTLVVSLAALALGCLLAAIAPSIGVLIVARVVQGVGGAVFPLAFGIIRDEFPAARVSSAVAAISAIVAAGGGLGVVLAGPIVATLGYRWLFWIPLVVVGLTALAAHRFVPQSPVRTPGRINWAATLLLSGWLVALLLPVSKGASWGWTSGRVTGLLALAGVLLAGWLVAEARSANPLIDMRMMRRPGVWTTNLVALLYGGSMFAVYAFLPQFVQIPTSAGYGFGASVTQAGLLMLPMLVAMFVAGLAAGRLQARFSAKAQLATGAVCNVLASAMLTVAHDTRWEIGVAGGLVGLGIGLAFASMANLIVANVPPAQTGVATGMNANIRTIGGAIGAAVVSGVITAHPQASGLPREAGFTMGFLVLTGIALAAAMAALVVPSGRQAVQERREERSPRSAEPKLTGELAAAGR